jgi:hypothetical protein
MELGESTGEVSPPPDAEASSRLRARTCAGAVQARVARSSPRRIHEVLGAALGFWPACSVARVGTGLARRPFGRAGPITIT